MAAAIIIPILFPLGLPIKASPMTKAGFNAIETLKEGDVVYMSLDLDPASTAELEPFFRAVILQLKRKNVKIAFGSLWYAAPPLIRRWLAESVDQAIIPAGGEAGYEGKPDRALRQKNVDYAYLGFREGKQATIQNLGADLVGTFDGVAADGTPIAKIPFMSGMKQLKDFKMIDPGVGRFAGRQGVRAVRAVHLQPARWSWPARRCRRPTCRRTCRAASCSAWSAAWPRSAEYETLVGKPGAAASRAPTCSTSAT
jgi:hypothetical protein